MTTSTPVFYKRVQPRRIFDVTGLPLIAWLFRVGFHRYRRRWVKSLCKRPARAIFDFAYHVLRLGGTGTMILHLPAGARRLSFNGRNSQFAGIYAIGKRLYEPEVSSLLDVLLDGEDVFFDVGANWGCLAFYAAGNPDCHGAIHAFEPMPDSFADLEDLVRQANLGERIRCHRVALSDRVGDGHMAVADGVSSGLACMTDDQMATRVTLARLDDLDLPDPSIIKLDVEDHELQVFRGGEALLKRVRPHLIFENWLNLKEPGRTAAALRYAEALGYALFQPCWLYPADGTYYIWPNDQPPDHTEERVLALVPMSVEQRFLMQERINVFACHKNRLHELEHGFSVRGQGDPGVP